MDEKIHRLTRMRAVELDTLDSVQERAFLTRLSDWTYEGVSAGGSAIGAPLYRRLRILAEEFDSCGIGLQLSDNLPRKTLYDTTGTSPDRVSD